MGRQLLAWAKRRWWALALCLLIAAAFGVGLFQRSEPLYRAERQILFTVSPTFQDPTLEVNPFLNFVPNLNTAIDVVAISVMSPDFAEQLAPPGSGVTYSAGQSPLTGAPVMMLQVEAALPKRADEVADQLVDIASQVLRKQQAEAGAPKTTWVSDSLISSTVQPERIWSKQVRLTILGVAMGLGLSACLLALLLRRDLGRARRSARPQPLDHRPPEPSAEPGGASNVFEADTPVLADEHDRPVEDQPDPDSPEAIHSKTHAVWG